VRAPAQSRSEFISDLQIVRNADDFRLFLETLHDEENLKAVNAVLRNFAAAGIEAAIDDFGTGFSFLAYLQELHIDALKIDKSFLDSYLHTHDSTLISAVMRMAHELGIAAAAEGVEHEEQLQLLNSVQCDQYQGYLFAEPLSSS